MRAFAVIGPSQSGKTTLASALAHLEDARPVTSKFFGDASITTFTFMGDRWAALDVPGGHDNLSQAGPVLAACDAAVVCVPAEADAAVLAAPFLRLIGEAGIPTFLFLNKIDAATDRVSEVVSSLQPYCNHGMVLRQIPIRSGSQVAGAIDLISERAWEYRENQRSALVELPEEMRERETEARAGLMETLADFDDHLLEQIIEDQRPLTKEIYKVATSALQHHDLVPVLIGAASHGNGILRLMKSLRHEVPHVDALRERLGLPADVVAAGCLADQVKHVGKIVLLRSLADGVAPGVQLADETVGSLNGTDGKSPVASVPTGEFACTIKSDHVSPGAFQTPDGTVELPQWAEAQSPSSRRLMRPVHEKDENKLSAALARLAEID